MKRIGLFTTASILAVTATSCAPAEEDEQGVGVAQSALTSCSGDGCDGLDPSTTTCQNDAITVRQANIYRNGTNVEIGYVELRWSNACGTNWSRVTRTDGAYAEGMYASVSRADGRSYSESLTGYSQIWSPMVYARGVCAWASGLIDESWTSGSAQTSSAC